MSSILFEYLPLKFCFSNFSSITPLFAITIFSSTIYSSNHTYDTSWGQCPSFALSFYEQINLPESSSFILPLVFLNLKEKNLLVYKHDNALNRMTLKPVWQIKIKELNLMLGLMYFKKLENPNKFLDKLKYIKRKIENNTQAEMQELINNLLDTRESEIKNIKIEENSLNNLNFTDERFSEDNELELRSPVQFKGESFCLEGVLEITLDKSDESYSVTLQIENLKFSLNHEPRIKFNSKVKIGLGMFDKDRRMLFYFLEKLKSEFEAQKKKEGELEKEIEKANSGGNISEEDGIESNTENTGNVEENGKRKGNKWVTTVLVCILVGLVGLVVGVKGLKFYACKKSKKKIILTKVKNK